MDPMNEKEHEQALVRLSNEIINLASEKAQGMGLFPRDLAAALILAAAEISGHASYTSDPQEEDLEIAIELFSARFNRVRKFHASHGASENPALH